MKIVVDLVDKTERLPTAKDADAQGCVAVLHRQNGFQIMHWSNVVRFGSYITHWGTYKVEGE